MTALLAALLGFAVALGLFFGLLAYGASRGCPYCRGWLWLP